MASQKKVLGSAFFNLILALGLLSSCNLPSKASPTGKPPSNPNASQPVTEAVTETNPASPIPEPPKKGRP